jgi:hypothetical protein
MKQSDMLLIGGVIAVAGYFLLKNSTATAAVNQETPEESAQSGASTLVADLESLFPGQ